MTAFLILVAALTLVELTVGLRTVRRNRPSAPPPSHREWASDRLPSHPYAGS